MHSVLLVYHRISQPPDNSCIDTLYNEWLLDIPKLMNLADVYGESNSEIVAKIITNVYRIFEEEYQNDTRDIFNLIYKHELLD